MLTDSHSDEQRRPNDSLPKLQAAFTRLRQSGTPPRLENAPASGVTPRKPALSQGLQPRRERLRLDSFWQ
jgi:hypothetical protein